MAEIANSNKIEFIVAEYAKLIQKEMHVSSIYLFGSYAKNNYDLDSDIDVAVVSDNFTGDTIEDTLKLMRIRRKVDTRIEPHPFSTAEFLASNPFVTEIVNTGIRIL